MNLRPFFSFFGSKWRVAKKYPSPKYDTIVEPFAGSAGYSVRYPDKNVILVERDPKIAEVWRYLTSTSEEEIRNLPLLRPGQSVDDLGVPDGARRLIGFWLNKGGSSPAKSLSAWGRNPSYASQFWGENIRDRVASQVPFIRHWQVIEGDYTDAPNVEATWFVDPPYQRAGKNYTFGSGRLDFSELGTWARSRLGQVIACENAGADWLSFRPMMEAKAMEGSGRSGTSAEVIWTNAT